MVAGVKEMVAEDSRTDILRAAATCFMERGYTETSIDDVARRLGATKGRIYHHFHSKADLFAAVFRTGMEMNFAAVRPLSELRVPTLQRWRRMALAHVMQMIETKPFQRAVWIGVEMYLRGATTPAQREAFSELVAFRSAYGGLFRDTLIQGRHEGIFHFDNPSIANQLMFMSLNSPIFWYSPRQDETAEDRRAIAADVVEFTYGGLTAGRNGKE